MPRCGWQACLPMETVCIQTFRYGLSRPSLHPMALYWCFLFIVCTVSSDRCKDETRLRKVPYIAALIPVCFHPESHLASSVFRTAVIRIGFCFYRRCIGLQLEKAKDRITAAVWKKDKVWWHVWGKLTRTSNMRRWLYVSSCPGVMRGTVGQHID